MNSTVYFSLEKVRRIGSNKAIAQKLILAAFFLSDVFFSR